MVLNENIINSLMENLKANNMKPYFVNTRDEAKELVLSLISEGDTVANGGSVTLNETGVLQALRERDDVTLLDKSKEGLTKAEIDEINLKAFTTDVYLMSTNALTLNGELYNVDGNSNRVAALLYGPKSVIIVCGVIFLHFS